MRRRRWTGRKVGGREVGRYRGVEIGTRSDEWKKEGDLLILDIRG